MNRMNLASSRFAAHTLLTSLLISITSTIAMAKPTLLYIATQNPDAMGITVAEFDSATGVLSKPAMAIETRDPAHFTLSKDGKRLYMCNTGTPGGVSAFAVENGGVLKFLNYRESKGRGPSYVSVDGSGKYVLAANYGGGFVEV
jgi:6-phosphogluconolactonase